MIIKVLYSKTTSFSQSLGAGHVAIVAACDKEDEIIGSKMGEIKEVYFSYTSFREKSIIVSSQEFKDSMHDGPIITLKSDVSFKDFLKALIRSEYKTNVGYDAFDKNCVHATLDVLKLAGHNIEVKKKTRCKHLLLFFYCPTSIITPRELFADVETYAKNLSKIHSQQDNSRVHLKYE